jgi:multidrug efflux pump subunit AcrB
MYETKDEEEEFLGHWYAGVEEWAFRNWKGVVIIALLFVAMAIVGFQPASVALLP